jgi:hypothetical protein
MAGSFQPGTRAPLEEEVEKARSRSAAVAARRAGQTWRARRGEDWKRIGCSGDGIRGSWGSAASENERSTTRTRWMDGVENLVGGTM